MTTPDTLLDEAARVHHASAEQALRNGAAALETMQAALDAAHADIGLLRAELNNTQSTVRAVTREALRLCDEVLEETERLRAELERDKTIVAAALAWRAAIQACDGWHEAEERLMAALDEWERGI
jgi:phage-related tail protein